MNQSGRVYLVGAGPGDVGLLTMRGAELLRRADVVIYDALVNPALLKFAPEHAELIFRGKRSDNPALAQNELNELLVRKAREGKTVVRLKGGDPYIFGRGGEEAEAVAAAKLEFEVVPGISSAVAAPNYAGIPVTHRAHCSSLTIITGHEDPNKEKADLHWEQLARIPGTLVILMGLRRVREVTEALIRHGRAPTTPAAMIRWGTTGQQQSVVAPLSELPDAVEKAEFTAPAITVIGDVVQMRGKLNWFENRPFFSKRIVVTRSREQASELTRPLAELGAEVLEIPVIKFAPPTRKDDLKDALLALNEYDWLIFTSPNGVTFFFNYFFKAFDDLRDIGGVKIAAVGPGTAAKLQELHLKVDLMPEEATATKVAEALAGYMSLDNLRILLMRAEVANPELPRLLDKMGGIVDDVACYRTVPETEDETGAAANFSEHGADWITFTSGSTVENFHSRFNLLKTLEKFPTLKIASIGPETTKALTALRITPTVEAPTHTMAGLVEAMEKWARRRR